MGSTYSYRGLYLLHFEPRYKHAGHYLGYAKRGIVDYARRVIAGTTWAPHPLVESALLNGCTVTIAKTWPGRDRADRRRMRAGGSLARICPICLSGEHPP